MHLHYLTLQRQVAFLQSICGNIITSAFTQRKNEWTLTLAKDGRENGCLQLCCDGQFPYILHLEHCARGKNSTEVIAEITGKEIAGISLLPGERIIEISFTDWESRLLLRFFTTRTNFFLVNANGEITSAFKNAKQHTGEIFSLPENDREQFDLEAMSREQFKEIVAAHENISIQQLLKRFQHFTRPLSTEILYRCEIGEKKNGREISANDIQRLYDTAQKIIEELATEQARIYFQDELPEKFSLIPLQHLAGREEKIVENINAALRIFNFQTLKNRGLLQKKTQFSRVLERKIQSLNHTMSHLEKQTFDPAKKEQFQKIGQLIVTQPHLLEEGQSTVELVDYFHPEMIKIAAQVKPELSAKENAEVYFRKAREYDERVKSYDHRKADIRKQMQRLNTLLKDLQETGSFKKIKQIETTLKSGHLLAHRSDEAAIYRLPYKQYEKDGFFIWVGRSAKDNDSLTFKYAGRDDIWLHVQGYAGSHVVVRNPAKKEHLPKSVLEYAARLAVTFSAAKHASYLPVIYTPVKYVRKPRKSAPGAVLPSQVKTIFADPLQ